MKRNFGIGEKEEAAPGKVIPPSGGGDEEDI